MKVHIEQGTPDKASHIASLIMEAMNTDCCQNFAGPHHTLVDFHQMMERLVKMEDSQYSYLNTLVASNSEGIITGILVAYDGARLKELRSNIVQTFTLKKRRYCSKNNEISNNIRIFATKLR